MAQYRSLKNNNKKLILQTKSLSTDFGELTIIVEVYEISNRFNKIVLRELLERLQNVTIQLLWLIGKYSCIMHEYVKSSCHSLFTSFRTLPIIST